MFLQVVAEFPGIGNMRRLEEHEIRVFYDGIRNSLKQRTKQRT